MVQDFKFRGDWNIFRVKRTPADEWRHSCWWVNTLLLMSEHTPADEWTLSCWWVTTLLLMSEHTPADEWTHSCWWVTTLLLMSEHTPADEWAHPRIYGKYHALSLYTFVQTLLRGLTLFFYTFSVADHIL